MTAVLVVAAVLALLAIGSQAQSCVPFTGAPRTGHKCDSLVSYPSVLLLANQSYAQVLCSVFHFPFPFFSFIILVIIPIFTQSWSALVKN
jgi:hypothetical protein